MRILQTCGRDCPHNMSVIAEGPSVVFGLLGKDLLINGKKYFEDCPECGHIAIFICENEPRRVVDGEAQETQTV